MNEKMFEEYLVSLIKTALAEDIGAEDITTSAIFSDNDRAEGRFIIKAEGIIAGLDVIEKLFCILDKRIAFNRLLPDGKKVAYGDIAASINGPTASILTAERTVLNILQRMSGIATATNLYVEKIKGTSASILDTRKTVPGLRYLDKLAVKLGGGSNHRIGLYDMFLIKDNHIQAAGSLTEAVNRCVNYRNKKYPDCKIEVEVENMQQVIEAASLPVDVIMLDNMSPAEMKDAIHVIAGRAKTEASGGINLETVREAALAGVDYISIGALTHSVKALDISLELKLL